MAKKGSGAQPSYPAGVFREKNYRSWLGDAVWGRKLSGNVCCYQPSKLLVLLN